MWEISGPLLEDAKKEAEKMLERGEVIRGVPFGHSRDSIFVATDRELVRGTDSFQWKGHTFYVGYKI